MDKLKVGDEVWHNISKAPCQCCQRKLFKRPVRYFFKSYNGLGDLETIHECGAIVWINNNEKHYPTEAKAREALGMTEGEVFPELCDNCQAYVDSKLKESSLRLENMTKAYNKADYEYGCLIGDCDEAQISGSKSIRVLKLACDGLAFSGCPYSFVMTVSSCTRDKCKDIHTKRAECWERYYNERDSNLPFDYGKEDKPDAKP